MNDRSPARFGREALLFVAGVAFLLLAKMKNLVAGYKTPKPFSIHEVDRCIDYDVSIVENWLKYPITIVGQHVLELGPGSDLGIGLYLLARGASKYSAVDRHNLIESVPDTFYSRFRERYPVPSVADAIQDGRLRYIARSDFDIAAEVPANSVDVVLSNAAFEHFDDVEATVHQLSRVVRPGGTICAVIDLQTHSRWIRDIDPNNIYRYPEWLYRVFYFPGQPNRVRPREYRRIFEGNGWTAVTITPSKVHDSTGKGVHRRFRGDPYLNCLSVVLCATKQ